MSDRGCCAPHAPCYSARGRPSARRPHRAPQYIPPVRPSGPAPHTFPIRRHALLQGSAALATGRAQSSEQDRRLQCLHLVLIDMCHQQIATACLNEVLCCQGSDVDSLLVAVIGSCGIARVHEGACFGKILSPAPAFQIQLRPAAFRLLSYSLACLTKPVTAFSMLTTVPYVAGQQAGRSQVGATRVVQG